MEVLDEDTVWFTFTKHSQRVLLPYVLSINPRASLTQGSEGAENDLGSQGEGDGRVGDSVRTERVHD